MKISIVVPCYNEEDNVDKFFGELKSTMEKAQYSYEIIFINDGSNDRTFDKLKKIYSKNSNRVEVISFSRNFGKEASMLSGLKHARGEYVTIIDADLQQSPQVVIQMVDFLDNNISYDCVAAYQDHRLEAKSIIFLKKIFYKVILWLTLLHLYQNISVSPKEFFHGSGITHIIYHTKSGKEIAEHRNGPSGN